MIFNNRITDITYNKILPKVVDTKNDGNVATARVLGVQIGRTWTGHTMNQPAVRLTVWTSSRPHKQTIHVH
jgi:hypothetical protein